ncbi:transglycosylase domain-containing protein [Aeromonas caviae]|uniref:transglycosylase domain-containing protein n=1 Tax=Aeromonas caviae TaxID=648 RepID=UPI003CE867A5
MIEKAMADECCLELPRLLKNTLVVGEDHRFWNHSGVDYFSLLRAIVKTGFFKNREGGSTIAMQLVRVITSKEGANKSYGTRAFTGNPLILND